MWYGTTSSEIRVLLCVSDCLKPTATSLEARLWCGSSCAPQFLPFTSCMKRALKWPLRAQHVFEAELRERWNECWSWASHHPAKSYMPSSSHTILLRQCALYIHPSNTIIHTTHPNTCVSHTRLAPTTLCHRYLVRCGYTMLEAKAGSFCMGHRSHLNLSSAISMFIVCMHWGIGVAYIY